MNSPQSHSSEAPKILLLILGLAVGVIVANLYYAQPLIGLISQSIGLSPAAAGLIVMLTQVGYGLGVLFIVPLGDLVENRKLILSMIVVPYAAHLTPEATRGRVVGNLMSGLMIGIMLSRPIASFLTDLFSWHAVFFLSAGLMTLIGLLLMRYLPERHPGKMELPYASLLGSMGQLFLRMPVLRRRAIYQAFMFGAFSLFWTATPLLLAGPEFHLSQTAIALFALAGVAGAIVAPLAGRFADKGWSRQGTAAAMISAAASFLLTHLFAPGSVLSLVFLVIAAILLDAGITANLVLGQRAIFSLRAKYRSRLNGVYIATIFVGGAIGSTVAAWSYAKGGWQLTSWLGFLFPTCAFLYFLTERLTGFYKPHKLKKVA